MDVLHVPDDIVVQVRELLRHVHAGLLPAPMYLHNPPVRPTWTILYGICMEECTGTGRETTPQHRQSGVNSRHIVAERGCTPAPVSAASHHPGCQAANASCG